MYKIDEYTVERKLIVHCPNEFNEALEFSAENVNNELQIKIMQLLTGSYYNSKELHISKDFIKHSFQFAFVNPETNDDTQKIFLSGGIILHGYEETFSVEINAKSNPHYSIHT